MKEITPDFEPKQDPVHQERQIKHEKGFLGSMSVKKNHVAYKFRNGVLKRLTDADYGEEQKKFVQRGGMQVEINFRKLIYEEDTAYLTALNDANAIKKLKKKGITVRIIQ